MHCPLPLPRCWHPALVARPTTCSTRRLRCCGLGKRGLALLLDAPIEVNAERPAAAAHLAPPAGAGCDHSLALLKALTQVMQDTSELVVIVFL